MGGGDALGLAVDGFADGVGGAEDDGAAAELAVVEGVGEYAGCHSGKGEEERGDTCHGELELMCEDGE